MERILIFIPMYNCEKQIPRVVRRIAALGEEQQRFAGVLIVDNRSSDGSVAAAAQAITALQIPALVVRNCENYSLGGSHKVAFAYALEHGYDYVVVLHGDDQGDIADLLPLLRQGAHRNVDCLLGSRFHPQSRLVDYSRFRIFGNRVFNAFFSLCTGRRVTDLGAGLNLYRTGWLREKFYLPFPNDLSFNVFLLLYSIYTKAEFLFFPLTWREEDQVSNAKLWKQTQRMLKLLARYVFGRKKVFAPVQNEWSQIDYRFEIMAEEGQQ